ncbi:hypothetical protein BUALT_Bualt09G0118900 [Buddleja alternifolia]|uniref:Uncharacterized protein n=1 Tax=Buddleja alternifolia TaxID=168488 RepID=A0AAV6X1Y6_9LAMI|nr:hypothetical protein BUALT_Bualt09G0118900 [Buddleja alternifolia]
MEGGKQSGSSLASDLFGAKDSSAATSSSSGIFGSIFAPPAKVLGRESLHSSETEKKNDNENPAWSAKTGVSGGGGQNKSTTSKDNSSYYQEEKVQPFHYSSSIYYGGQDVYSRPESVQNPTFTTCGVARFNGSRTNLSKLNYYDQFNKDGGEDDSGGASRGNWWQGSLYY